MFLSLNFPLIVFKKREMKRGGDEDDSEATQSVKRVLTSEGFLSKVTAYWLLSDEQKNKLGLYGFFFLTPELQKIIAQVDAATLLKLGQTNKFFADLARRDQIWKDLFEKDFPHDWKYCQGELPFFVLTENHPLWQPGLINEIDKSGWKRFYLHTRWMYFEKVNDGRDEKLSFNTWYKKYQKKRDKDLDIANLCHLFVCTMSWLFKGRGAFRFEANTPNDSRMIFWQNIHVNEWLRPYVLCSLIHDNRDYFENDLYTNYTGISETPFYREYKKKFNINQSQWLEAWKQTLFSRSDKENLERYLQAKIERPGIFRGFDNLEHMEQIDVAVAVLHVWDMLSKAYENIKSIYTDAIAFMYYMKMIPFSMIADCAEIKEDTKILMTNNPFEFVKFNFKKSQIFSIPRLDKKLSELTNPLTFFTNKPETGQLLQLFKLFCVAPRKFEYYVTDPDTNKKTEHGRLFFIKSQLCMQCNSAPGTHACGRCLGAKYCGRECQKKHWQNGGHKCF